MKPKQPASEEITQEQIEWIEFTHLLSGPHDYPFRNKAHENEVRRKLPNSHIQSKIYGFD